ncbi:MAG: NFACT family protein [Acidaminococcaceae bacterium]|nr:NFACT family protein [Acidaminococcaceae bacterium]MDD4721557.1 NFACT family protein [Acidaminococcaceae bacterium]
MNLEGITLNLLTNELKKQLENGKIYKIFMPAKNSLLLMINKNNTTLNLSADFSGATPLLYIADTVPERPNTPPAFCMLLRKHLEEGRIASFHQQDLDRVLIMDIDLIGPARQIITKHLIFELTGKNSNIIFTDERQGIIDSLRHIGKSQSSFRQILPNLPYEFPPKQEGLNFLTASARSIIDACQHMPQEPVLKNLIGLTLGIGKNTALEVLKRSGLAADAKGFTLLEYIACEKNLSALQKEINNCFSAEHYNVYGIISKKNRMKIVVPYKPLLDSDEILQVFPSLLNALNFSAKLIPIQIPDKELLSKTVSNTLTKVAKKIKLLAKDLTTAQKANEQKIIADTIMANIYNLQKGSSSCTLNNIYDGEPLVISLSPILSPIDNAQSYYKKYNKFNRAVNEIKQQQEETQALLTYLESIDASIETASTKNEISEIKQEMVSAGLLPDTSKKKKSPTLAKSTPASIKFSEETLAYIGKNNRQNDFVTFKIGKSSDLWFHTKNIPGSHVILKTTLPEPTREDILHAASLAAFYSKGKNSDLVPVDYTQRRFVKKPNGAKPGFVIYTEQKTLYVKPEKY